MFLYLVYFYIVVEYSADVVQDVLISLSRLIRLFARALIIRVNLPGVWQCCLENHQAVRIQCVARATVYTVCPERSMISEASLMKWQRGDANHERTSRSVKSSCRREEDVMTCISRVFSSVWYGPCRRRERERTRDIQYVLVFVTSSHWTITGWKLSFVIVEETLL